MDTDARHEGGAVYGSPRKLCTGETGIKGLTIMGTDQGFLGIIGAALSGISLANRWVLKEQVSEPVVTGYRERLKSGTYRVAETWETANRG